MIKSDSTEKRQFETKEKKNIQTTGAEVNVTNKTEELEWNIRENTFSEDWDRSQR